MKLLAALLFAAAPAIAQEVVFSPAQTEQCLSNRGGADCALASAEACMIATPGGSSTVVMSGCLDQAFQYWDQRLNRVYQASRQQALIGDEGAPEWAPSEGDALRAMQRAWIAFRDAKCAYAASLWGGGSGGGPATLGCLAQTTAEQTLYLESNLR